MAAQLLFIINWYDFTWRLCSFLDTIHYSSFPIRPINFSDPVDVSHHDRMVALVEQMLKLHQDLIAGHTPDRKTALQRQIDAIDTQIDQLVYEVYRLTDEEIEIVEGKI